MVILSCLTTYQKLSSIVEWEVPQTLAYFWRRRQRRRRRQRTTWGETLVPGKIIFCREQKNLFTKFWKNFFSIFDLIQAKTLLVAKGGLPLNSCSSQTIWTTDLGFVPFNSKLSLVFSKVLLQLVKKIIFLGSWGVLTANNKFFPSFVNALHLTDNNFKTVGARELGLVPCFSIIFWKIKKRLFCSLLQKTWKSNLASRDPK